MNLEAETITYQSHNDKDINCCGTHYQGNLTADYAKLKKLFGQPSDGDGYKVDAEWDVEFSDGTVATIYNWKDGKNYCGSHGTPKTKITDWHIGGMSKKAVELIQAVVYGDIQKGKDEPKNEIKEIEDVEVTTQMMKNAVEAYSLGLIETSDFKKFVNKFIKTLGY